LFGYPSEQMVGAHISMLMPEDMREPHKGYVERYLESRTAHVIGKGREVEAMRQDGSLFPVHIALGQAQVDEATVFVAMIHDLTRRKAAEEAAARSQRMDAIGRMTGGIAHDFNNLLTVVIGNLELLDLEHMPKNADQIIADALAAAELGADLTSRLVMFARKRPLRLELIDLNAGLVERRVAFAAYG
jgi:PAS domain S-box-containing protein